MLLVYKAIKKEVVFITDGADMNMGDQNITVPTAYSGENIECFNAFISADGVSVSNSIYAVSVVVS